MKKGCLKNWLSVLTGILLFLVTYQEASSQVSSWRSGGLNSSPPTNSGSMRMSPSQQDYSQWRNQRPANPYYNNRPMTIHNPIWVGGLHPWFNGYGYYNMYPYSWYDNYGYRNRGRIRVYKDGKKDTVYIKPIRVSFGIQSSTSNEIGAWLTIGNNGYFIGEYQTTINKNRPTFFPNGRLNSVDFPLVNDWINNRTLYLGVGKKYGRNGIHMSIGFNREIVRFQGKDAVGYITFPKSDNSYASLKIGYLRDIKNSTIKLDYDAVRGVGIVGVGLNF